MPIEEPVEIVPVYAIREGLSNLPTGSETIYTSLLPFFASEIEHSFQTSVDTASSVRGGPLDEVDPVVVGVSFVLYYIGF